MKKQQAAIFTAVCYRAAQRKRAKELAKAAAAALAPGAEDALPPRTHINGFDHPPIAAVLDTAPGLLQPVQWGLVPPWARHEAEARTLAARTLNARNDTVFEKPSFRDSITARRAVVWLDGFFEWQHRPGGLKVPYYFQRPGGQAFAVGAIWSPWAGQPTVSLLTVPGNALVNRIHNAKERMPLLLPDALWPLWLRPGLARDTIEALMQPCPDDFLEAWPLNPKWFAANTNPNQPEALAPWQVPDEAPTLF